MDKREENKDGEDRNENTKRFERLGTILLWPITILVVMRILLWLGEYLEIGK